MTQDITKEVLALSMHVAAASSQITIQTQERMNLVTKSVLDTAEQTLKMINMFMMNSQKHSHLEAVIEEKDEDCQKDSKTKECYVEQHQQSIYKENFNIEVIDQQIQNENCHPNISLNSTKTTPQGSLKSQSQSQIQEEQQCAIFQQSTPMQQKRQSLLSQQLSQIKIDKAKEAEEQRELLKIIETVDPEEMIPKLKSIEVYDEIKQQSSKKEVLEFSDKQLIEINENKENQLKDSPNKSEWYESSSVEYRATSYNTNESSNLDHHSYRWKSSGFGDDNLFGDCGFQFQSSVFDFPFPEDFNTNSVAFQQNMNLIEEKNQFTPKKKRLYCNNKKVPHWAENLDKVSQYQNNQQNLQQNQIFGKMKQRVLDIAKQFSDNKYQRRGSSAMWQISKEKHEKMQHQMQKLQQMQDENLQKLRVHQQESMKKQLGWAAKTQYFLTSIKKKILDSFEKNNSKYKK